MFVEKNGHIHIFATILKINLFLSSLLIVAAVKLDVIAMDRTVVSVAIIVNAANVAKPV